MTPAALELSWTPPAGGLTNSAELKLEKSDDFTNWTTHSRSILPKASATPWSTLLPSETGHQFFRLRSNFEIQLVQSEPEEAFGYGQEFRTTLAKLGQISLEQFSAMFPTPSNYLKGVSWDVTQAAFFPQFNNPPASAWGTNKEGRFFLNKDFSLNTAELAAFKKNGFVVSERLGDSNFADVYYDVFQGDLPVFVSSDSVLHAWHRSFEAILEQLEELYLAGALDSVLNGMAEALPELAKDIPEDLRQSLADADYFLAVARSLSAGTQIDPKLSDPSLVTTTLSLVNQEQIAQFNLFGRLDRNPDYSFDFSQFKVRSHYVNSARLTTYFKAMIWCSRVDFRIAGNPSESSARELGTALILNELAHRANILQVWEQVDTLIQKLIGPKDSMDFRQLDLILKAAGVNTFANIQSTAQLASIQESINEGQFGIQEILGDLYYSPFGPPQILLPRSFTVLGQRFTMDSWALGKVIFDSIIWDSNGIPEMEDKVQRRMASALDVAFSALGNNLVTDDIAARIRNPNGTPFRDGLPYQHNLAAARMVLNSQTSNVWTDNLYNDWLATLRELSRPTLERNYPDTLRTKAWAYKNLSTQLASWTELKHDTLLYTKQLYGGMMGCSYPSGYVEPAASFWGHLSAMTSRTAAMLNALPMSGKATWHARLGYTNTIEYELTVVQSNQVQFLQRFSDTTRKLQLLSDKELRQEPFNADDLNFLGDWIEKMYTYIGEKKYTGWYPGLFYRDREGYDQATRDGAGELNPLDADAGTSFALVADILTDPPAETSTDYDPGAVLHEGVGNVDFILLAVDRGYDRMVFGGPVFSHYEFELPGAQRMNDAEWRTQINSTNKPPHPEWTREWLVGPGPGAIQVH